MNFQLRKYFAPNVIVRTASKISAAVAGMTSTAARMSGMAKTVEAMMEALLLALMKPIRPPAISRCNVNPENDDSSFHVDSVRLKEMPQFFAFGSEVVFIVAIGFYTDRNLLDDLQPVPLESDTFLGVVGQQPDFLDAEIGKDLGADAVLAQVHWEAQFFIGLHCVVAALLQLVGLDLGREADAPPLLPHVKNDAVSRPR